MEEVLDKIKPLSVDYSVIPEWQRERQDAHLQAWFMSNEVNKEMIFKDAFNEQILFVRDTLCGSLLSDAKVEVISTHMSKSIVLPVYKIEIGNDIIAILRGNFHDWKVSIISSKFLIYFDDFSQETLFSNNGDISKVYCEGFKDEWVFPEFKTDKLLKNRNYKFTVEIQDKFRLFTFFYLLTQSINNEQVQFELFQ